MESALSRLKASVTRIRSVADDMDNRTLTATSVTRALDETLRCSCTVILSGFLENFLKEIAQSFITVICSRKIRFSELPKKTKQKHFVEGGKLLGLKYQNNGKVSWINSDYFDMAERLSSPSDTSTSYSLLWEAYATTQGNPGPGVIEDVLSCLGVDKCPTNLDRMMNGNYPTVKLSLQSFIDVRNECAHTGTAISVPSTSALKGYCDLIEDLSSSIVLLLNERLGQAPYGVDVNMASYNELIEIPYLGPVRVNSLLSYRSTHGRFFQIGDLVNIPGYGSNLMIDLTKYLYVI